MAASAISGFFEKVFGDTGLMSRTFTRHRPSSPRKPHYRETTDVDVDSPRRKTSPSLSVPSSVPPLNFSPNVDKHSDEAASVSESPPMQSPDFPTPNSQRGDTGEKKEKKDVGEKFSVILRTLTTPRGQKSKVASSQSQPVESESHPLNAHVPSHQKSESMSVSQATLSIPIISNLHSVFPFLSCPPLFRPRSN